MNDWKPGDRIECINDNWERRLLPIRLPVQGYIYTVRDLMFANDAVAVLLVEIDNPIGEYWNGQDWEWCEPVFSAYRFRKVVERKTSIAIFEAILRGARVPEDA